MAGKRWTALGSLVAALALLAAATVWAAASNQEPEPVAPQGPLSSAFTYQGRLTHDGRPVNDLCDFEFNLYATDVAPSPIGMQPVDEQYLLDIEREVFVSLAGEPKSQARMGHMLKTGKPLRN